MRKWYRVNKLYTIIANDCRYKSLCFWANLQKYYLQKLVTLRYKHMHLWYYEQGLVDPLF